jgi:RNA polymerase sigma factor (sigma-70 family)
MNVHVSYKVKKSSDLEQLINQSIEKLNRRLQVFNPDLVHLHAIIEERTARAGFHIKLDLRLPSGDIASHVDADRVETAVKGAFDDLVERVTKHKAHLRAEYTWPHRRVERTRPLPQVPFEETIAAVPTESASQADISGYVNANFPRLMRFVDRELRFRENNGELRPNQVNPQEVIGEAIANALGREEKPERLRLETWLYHLTLNAIRDLANRDGDGLNDVHLDQLARGTDTSRSEGSDEAMLQFHQPDESVTAESLIPNPALATPEESAASDEMVNLVEMALIGARQEDREAFLLFGIEGFTIEEISAISSRPIDHVRTSIKSAREHLRKYLPVPNEFKEKILQRSKTA